LLNAIAPRESEVTHCTSIIDFKTECYKEETSSDCVPVGFPVKNEKILLTDKVLAVSKIDGKILHFSLQHCKETSKTNISL